MIQTALWLDAADAATVTTVSGAVSQWNDKSGNGRNATQGTAGSRPAYSSTGFNSRPGVSFDGIDDFMSIGGRAISGTGYHYAMAIKPGAAALTSVDGDAVFWLRNAYETNGFLHILYRSNITSKFRTLINSNGDVANVNTKYLSTDSDTSEQVIAYGGPSTNLRRNGTLQSNGSDTTTAANTISYSGLLAEIGRYFINTTTYNGAFNIAEFVLVLSPSDNDILKLEGYLAHKWGLTANLPAGHPYKTIGPTP
jgi:hypothetical protein